MCKTTLIFLLGIYIGQEFGETLPNIQTESFKIYYIFTKSDFYNKLRNDFHK